MKCKLDLIGTHSIIFLATGHWTHNAAAGHDATYRGGHHATSPWPHRNMGAHSATGDSVGQCRVDISVVASALHWCRHTRCAPELCSATGGHLSNTRSSLAWDVNTRTMSNNYTLTKSTLSVTINIDLPIAVDAQYLLRSVL